MKISSKLIKDKALEIGFHKVGIAKAMAITEEKTNLELWLLQKRHHNMEWMNKRKEERGDIHKDYQNAKSIVSVGLNYFSGHKQEDLASDFKFSNYAWGDDYHQVVKTKLHKLLHWIRSIEGDIHGVVCSDTSPVMEKTWSQRAGIGWLGKHTNLISKDYGSWLFLGELILDIKLEYDDPSWRIYVDHVLLALITALQMPLMNIK